MSDLKELKEHIRLLEDERLYATAVDECLDEINDRLEAITDAVEKHAGELGRLVDAFNRAADAINRQADALKAFVNALSAATKPTGMDDVLGAVFKPSEPKPRAAKPKPKTKLSVVQKDGGPGAAP